MLIEVDICSQTGAVQEMLKKVQLTGDRIKENTHGSYTLQAGTFSLDGSVTLNQ